MPLDTRIALSGQPLQLESPLTQYSQLMNIQHAGTQNQLAQMQISAAQRAADEEAGFKNYLSTADLTTPEGQRGAMAYGKTGMSALKTIAEQKKASLESDEITAKVLGLAQKNFAARYSPLEAAAGQEQGVAGYVDAMYKDPILGPLAAKVKPKEQALADNLAMFKKDPNQWITAHANLEGQHLLDALKMSAAREAEARAFTPPAGTPTVPMNAPAAPVAPVAPAAPPVISQDRLTVSQDASGTSTYYIDGKPVDPHTFAAARASSAPATMLPNTRAADLASMSPAAATAPAPAVAPAAATAPAVAPVVAPAAQPNLLNNLTLRIKGIEEQRNRLLPDIGKSAAVKAQWEDLGKQIENLSKGFSVSPGAAHFVPGVGMVERPAAEPTSADVTTMKALGYPITQDGFKAFTEAKRQEKSKSEFEQLLEDSGMTDAQKKAARAERIKKESTFAPPMQVVMPVAIQDPKDPTKVIYVDRSQAIGQTPAAEVPKPLTAAQTQKLKTEKAADTAHVNASQSTANELEKLTNELVGSEDKKIKPHPGLGGITGYAALLPNLPKGSAAQAQQKLDTFKGKILALGREMASQNGKLGNMAVQEWKFVSDAVQALDPKAGNLDVQMRDVVRQAQAFAKNQKSKFDMTYEDTGAVAPAAGSGIDTSNPLLR